MENDLQFLDYTPSQTRADSARVGSGIEALDTDASKIAIDQEQRITRKPDDSVAESTSQFA